MGKISVIVPVYNALPHLLQCLEALQAQICNDIEFVLIDDGSTDGGAAVCDQFAQTDPRFRVIHKPNGGVSEARNDGMRAATGDYIGFVDSDDLLEPTMYQTMLNRLEAEHADGVFCGFYQDGRAGQSAFTREETADAVEAAWQLLTKDGYFSGPWNKLFDREILMDHQGNLIPFRSDLAIGEDEVWLHQVVAGCNRIAFCPEPLYHWKLRPGSATANKTLPASRLTVITSKREVIQMVSPYGRKFACLAKARMYKSLFVVRTQAYRWKDWKKLATVNRAMRPVFFAWLTCEEFPRGYKVNTLTMNVMMALRIDSRKIDHVLVMRDSWLRGFWNKIKKRIRKRMR